MPATRPEATAAWTADQPIVRIDDVHKSFGSVEVLKGVSFDVMKGDVVCVIGPRWTSARCDARSAWCSSSTICSPTRRRWKTS